MKEGEEKDLWGLLSQPWPSSQAQSCIVIAPHPHASLLELSPFMQINHPHPRVSSTLCPRWSLNILVHDNFNLALSWLLVCTVQHGALCSPAPLTLRGTIMEIGSIRPLSVTSL